MSLLLVFAVLVMLNGFASAAEVETTFAVVNYSEKSQLLAFNKKIGSSIGFGFGFGSDRSGTPDETTRKKVDHLIGRVQEILDMRPKGLHFKIKIFNKPKEVQAVYLKEYGHKVDFIAFYSPRSETIYVALSKLQRTVFAHEVAHAVIDRYFDKAPPVKVHELLAQYVEKQL